MTLESTKVVSGCVEIWGAALCLTPGSVLTVVFGFFTIPVTLCARDVGFSMRCDPSPWSVLVVLDTRVSSRPLLIGRRDPEQHSISCLPGRRLHLFIRGQGGSNEQG